VTTSSSASTGGSGGSSSTGSTSAATTSGTGGDPGTGGGAGAGMGGMPPGTDAGSCGTAAGACVNATDCGIGKTAIDPKVTTCAKMCNGSGTCTSTCLMKEGITMGCAKCYGDVTQCGRDMCAAPCFLDPSSKDCRDCTKMKGCDDKFLMCAGW
jgi:hypothetical protein